MESAPYHPFKPISLPIQPHRPLMPHWQRGCNKLVCVLQNIGSIELTDQNVKALLTVILFNLSWWMVVTKRTNKSNMMGSMTLRSRPSIPSWNGVESPAYKSCLFTKHLLTLEFFSASLFYPGHSDMATFTNNFSCFSIKSKLSDHFNDSNDNSVVKSEGDWLDEPQAELAPSAPSKLTEAVAIEVRFWLPSILHSYSYFL